MADKSEDLRIDLLKSIKRGLEINNGLLFLSLNPELSETEKAVGLSKLGLDNKFIANIMGKSESTVSSQLYNARKESGG